MIRSLFKYVKFFNEIPSHSHQIMKMRCSTSDHKSAPELRRAAADEEERKMVNLSKSGLSHIPHYWPYAGRSDLRQVLVSLDLSHNRLTSLETLSAAPQSPGQTRGTLGAVRWVGE